MNGFMEDRVMDELADMHNQQADQRAFLQIDNAALSDQPDPVKAANQGLNMTWMDESYSPPVSKPKYTEQQLGMMPDWIETSKRMYRVMEGYEFIGSDKQAAAYGMDLMAEFNWNVTGPAGFPGEAGISSPGLIGQVWNVLNSGGYTDLDGNLVTKENNANDFLFMLNTYADTKTEGATIKRSLRALFGAPETYGSIGGGIAAPFIKSAAMKSSSMTARQMLMGVAKAAGFTTEIAKRAPGKSGAVAGAAYADIYEGANMILETAAGMPPSLGEAVTRTVTSSLAGAGFGGVAGKVLGGAVEGAGPNTPPIRQEPDLGLPDDMQPRFFEPGKFKPPTAENPVSVVMPTETEPGIIAIHGSGADFEKFKLEFIGTGEGAQAYGYGLYFAEKEDIASYYKNMMQRSVDIDGKPYIRGNNINDDLVDPDIADDLGATNGDLEAAIKNSEEFLQEMIADDNVNAIRSTSRELEKLKELRGRITVSDQEGKMYKVGLEPKPEDMLDYQIPIEQQPENIQQTVKKALSYIYPDVKDPALSMRGSDLQNAIINRVAVSRGNIEKMSDPIDADIARIDPNNEKTDAAIAAQIMLEQGIPGMKYRDAGSRGGAKSLKDASFNYVIFDENAIKILEKYGIVGPVAITAVAAGQGADSDEGEVM